ncbi:unnamed protein product [Protopolystoma xenopodis]|uniref:Uncharacterized protein n=1 Tax=Protopolystoma xenopodis TaxID=117903 RepID=A0A448X187_9PLAT|nr:unnamed protein product [Protopolystoma xenopodis]
MLPDAMKLSLGKSINDIRLLNRRLKAREELVLLLLSQAQAVQLRLQTMQQYQEEVLSLSEIATRTTKTGLVAAGNGSVSSTTAISTGRSAGHRQLLLCLAAENKQVEQLRLENSTLRNSLEEHQAVLEMIMAKYRSQVSKCRNICGR